MFPKTLSGDPGTKTTSRSGGLELVLVNQVAMQLCAERRRPKRHDPGKIPRRVAQMCRASGRTACVQRKEQRTHFTDEGLSTLGRHSWSSSTQSDHGRTIYHCLTANRCVGYMHNIPHMSITLNDSYPGACLVPLGAHGIQGRTAMRQEAASANAAPQVNLVALRACVEAWASQTLCLHILRHGKTIPRPRPFICVRLRGIPNIVTTTCPQTNALYAHKVLLNN